MKIMKQGVVKDWKEEIKEIKDKCELTVYLQPFSVI